jgi:hypothetical protein
MRFWRGLNPKSLDPLLRDWGRHLPFQCCLAANELYGIATKPAINTWSRWNWLTRQV